jgi:hypothetical protein
MGEQHHGFLLWALGGDDLYGYIAHSAIKERHGFGRTQSRGAADTTIAATEL